MTEDTALQLFLLGQFVTLAGATAVVVWLLL